MIPEDFIYYDTIKSEFEYSSAYKYLDKYLTRNVFEQRSTKECRNSDIKDSTVWQFWDSGVEHSPKLVKKCIQSVDKFLNNDHVLLDSNNIKDYVEFPGYIIDKYNKGIISRAHFSDLLRLELLSRYGGIWIDSTVYISGPLPDYMTDKECFMFKSSVMNNSVIKASSWYIQSKVNNRLILSWKNLLYDYWKSEDCLCNYYLVHIAMSKIINEDRRSMIVFDRIPYFNNSEPHILWGRLGKRYDEAEWKHIKGRTPVHKLSYKERLLMGDDDTYFQRLMENSLD